MSLYPNNHLKPNSGFTLIELLVVIALIAVIAGGIGLALGQGNKGVALQNSQGTLTSALAGARAQAALNSRNAALFVNATPGADGFLREIRIAVRRPGPPVRWIITGEPIYLSNGIYLVPPSGAFPVTEVEYLPVPADWDDGRSTSYDDTDQTLWLGDGTTEASSSRYHRLVELNVRGTTANNGVIVVAPADVLVGGIGVSFRNPETLRGARISQYGVATLVAGKEAFSN